MNAPNGSSLRTVVSAALAGAIVGAASTALVLGGSASTKLSGGAAAAGLGLASGALLGALELGALRAGRARGAALRERVGVHLGTAVDAPRDAVIGLHTGVTLFALGAVVVSAVTALALVRLRTVQNLALQEGLTVVSVLGAMLGAAVLAALARGRVERTWRAVDARWRLPLPTSPALRSVVWVALPLTALGLAGLLVLGKVLGPLVTPFAVLAVLGVQVGLLAAISRVAVGRAPRAVVTASMTAGLAVVGLGAAHVVATRTPNTAATLDLAPWSAAMVRAARAATDIDFDGTSSLFGGRDCAPMSASRHPGATEVPGNGIDEDCNGADSTSKVAIPTGPRFRGPGGGRKRDIVWFIADALRADHTSAGGYKRQTMPAVDKLAKESLVFTEAFSQSSATMLSFPSFFTGIDPGRLVWRVQKDRLQLGRGQPTIAERLGAMGYRTGFAAGGYFKIRLPGLTENWSWVDYSDRKQTESSASAAALAARFITQSQQGDEPFCLVVYLPAPHAPYVSHGAGYPEYGKKPKDLYDSELNNADRYIGFMLELLQANEARWKDTVVVVTGDHGEEFNEHGGTEHANTCHVEVTHVPIFLRAPGEEPRRVSRRVGLVDLVPTMLDLVGGTARDDELDGHSLLLDDAALPADRPLFCSVVSQKAAQGSFFHRAVRSGKWFADKDLRGTGGLVLFDVEADPGELRPVKLEGEAARSAALLESWLDAQLTSNLGEIPLGGDM